jgi:hypothetical protein
MNYPSLPPLIFWLLVTIVALALTILFILCGLPLRPVNRPFYHLRLHYLNFRGLRVVVMGRIPYQNRVVYKH